MRSVTPCCLTYQGFIISQLKSPTSTRNSSQASTASRPHFWKVNFDCLLSFLRTRLPDFTLVLLGHARLRQLTWAIGSLPSFLACYNNPALHNFPSSALNSQTRASCNPPARKQPSYNHTFASSERPRITSLASPI